MALIAGRADHRVGTRADPELAGIGLRAQVAVVAGRPVGLCGIGADPCAAVTNTYIVALIAGGAGHRVGARARTGLAGVGLRTQVAVVAARAVRCRRIRADTRAAIANPNIVALVAGGADDGVGTGSDT